MRPTAAAGVFLSNHNDRQGAAYSSAKMWNWIVISAGNSEPHADPVGVLLSALMDDKRSIT